MSHKLKNKFIVAANWKMNKNLSEAESFILDLQKSLEPKENRVALFFPSFLQLGLFKNELSQTPILFGAQNCHFEDSGAFTGEVSPLMLADLGVQWALVGHSERRHVFGETDEMMAKKVAGLHRHKLTPVICVGETEKEKVDGKTLERVQLQLEKALSLSSTEDVVIAYEPVWAIGTGRVPTIKDITEVHQFLRAQLIRILGEAKGSETPILYGGSVTAQNAKEIESAKDVNGFLIGGASLKVDSYLSIYNGGQ